MDVWSWIEISRRQIHPSLQLAACVNSQTVTNLSAKVDHWEWIDITVVRWVPDLQEVCSISMIHTKLGRLTKVNKMKSYLSSSCHRDKAVFFQTTSSTTISRQQTLWFSSQVNKSWRIAEILYVTTWTAQLAKATSSSSHSTTLGWLIPSRTWVTRRSSFRVSGASLASMRTTSTSLQTVMRTESFPTQSSSSVRTGQLPSTMSGLETSAYAWDKAFRDLLMSRTSLAKPLIKQTRNARAWAVSKSSSWVTC